MNKTSQTKFHHYIPQFQLRFLTDSEGKLYIYDRRQNTIRRQTPGSIGGENKFYTYKDNKGTEQTHIEDLNTQIESIAAPIIKELHIGKKKNLTPQEKADLSVFLALNWRRTPTAKLRTEAMIKATATMYSRLNALDKNSFEKHVEEIEKKTGKNFGDKAELRKGILDNRYRIKLDNSAYLQSLVRGLEDISKAIQSMEWHIVVLNDTHAFLLNDINFTIEPVKVLSPDRGYGLLTAGTQSMCVLTNKVMIVLKPQPGGVVFINPDFRFIRSTNIINAVHSQRFLISHSEALLKNIVDRTKLYNIRPERIGVKVYSGPEGKEFTFGNDE